MAKQRSIGENIAYDLKVAQHIGMATEPGSLNLRVVCKSDEGAEIVASFTLTRLVQDLITISAGNIFLILEAAAHQAGSAWLDVCGVRHLLGLNPACCIIDYGDGPDEPVAFEFLVDSLDSVDTDSLKYPSSIALCVHAQGYINVNIIFGLTQYQSVMFLPKEVKKES